MADKWVCNASPLILLHRIGHLRLLSELCDSLVIPQGVIEEVLPHEDDKSEWESFLGLPNVLKMNNAIVIEPQIAGWDLGKGESEVLSWAVKHPCHEAILDDLEARKCARSIGVPVARGNRDYPSRKEKGSGPESRPSCKGFDRCRFTI